MPRLGKLLVGLASAACTAVTFSAAVSPAIGPELIPTGAARMMSQRPVAAASATCVQGGVARRLAAAESGTHNTQRPIFSLVD